MTTERLRNLMQTAWRLAREGARRYGGKAREYIAEGMRIAWRAIAEHRRVNRVDRTAGHAAGAAREGCIAIRPTETVDRDVPLCRVAEGESVAWFLRIWNGAAAAWTRWLLSLSANATAITTALLSLNERRIGTGSKPKMQSANSSMSRKPWRSGSSRWGFPMNLSGSG